MKTRDHLLQAAADLFYEEGIHHSGIDAVVARSGFSKPTLYNYFRSKEDLITAALELRAENRATALRSLTEDSAHSPREVLDLVIEYFVSWYDDEDYRGCALINGAIELPHPDHPGRSVVREHKSWMTDLLAEVAASAGLTRPRELAESLVLLEEGATVMAYVNEEGAIGRQLRRAAAAMIAAHEPK